VMHMACRFVCGDMDPARCDELAELFHLLESDFSIAGMFLPMETRSMKRRKAARDRILAIFEDEVRRAATEGTSDPDGYMEAVLRQSVRDRSAPTSDEIRLAGLAVMGAVFGAHTNTAITYAASLADLLEHPQVLAPIEAEIAGVLGDAPLDLAALCRMPLLLRAMNESMRLHGNGGLWRMTMRDVEIAGHTVKKGSLVGTSMGLVNLDETHYRDATRYDPDRYTTMVVDDLQSPPPKERRFGVFGIGRHLCPGRRLAYTMVGTALVVLLREYSLDVVSKPRGWFTLLTAGMARPLGKFVVRATPR
jgi:cytochrome P450